MSSSRSISSHGPRAGDPAGATVAPTPGARLRRIVELDPSDDRTYAHAVARVVPAIESALGPGVMADHARVQGAGLVLGDWRPARRAFRRAIRAQLVARSRPSVFVGDVRSFFASIEIGAVERALRRVGGPPADVDRVLATVRRFADRGIAGLPVGPVPSAPLANAVLVGLDEAIRAEGVQHLRWVDDVVAVCDDLRTATRVADAFHRSLAREGLQANLSKTMILTGADQAIHHLLGAAGYSPATGSRAMLRAP